MPEFEPGEHHGVICSALEDVELGITDRLMIFAPPRHTKSELGSKRFPAWYLGRHPKDQLITATYAAELAQDFGREVRDILRSDEYAQIFSTRLSPDSTSAGRWHTNAGGVYVAVGVGGPITGRGAHVALIDDPIKNRQDADSETVREGIWRWYSSTLRTRLMPGGRIILILTRWHEDDLAGRLLARQPDEWRVVELDAEKAPGVALWPQWYPWHELKRIESEISPRDYQALYRQNPTPDEGTYFKREHFKLYDPREFPENAHFYTYSDFAVTDEDDVSSGKPDETVFGLWGLDERGEWWMHPEKGSIRLMENSAKWVEDLIDLFEDFEILKFFGESGVIRRAVEPFLRMRMRQREAYCTLEWVTRTRDKVAMAYASRNLCDMGMIHIPDNSMGHEFIAECLKFPAGAKDHQVDMFTLLGLSVDQGLAADAPQEPESNKYPADYRRRRPARKSWRTV